MSPPGPGKTGAWKRIGEFTRNRAEFCNDMRQRYGEFCYFKIGPAHCYLVNDPDLVQEILTRTDFFPKTNSGEFLKPVLGNGLLVSKGDFHRRQRKLIQPAFTPKRVHTYMSAITEFAQATSERWVNGQKAVLNDEMSQLTLAIIAHTMFHTNVEGLLQRVTQAMDEILPVIDRMAKPSGKLAMMLPTIANFRFYRARRDLNSIIYDIIKEARHRNEDQGDLLSMLLFAKDDDGVMADEHLRDEALTIFLAGHETTALGLSWTWYLLAQHPEIDTKFHTELAEVLGGRLPTMEDLPNLPYLEKVVRESLRLYPPAYLGDRSPLEDWDTGEYIVPKGSYVFVSQYSMGRNDKYFPDPERFDPERWNADEMEKRPKFTFFPFGGGVHTCIGEHFAWAELTLIMATLAQRWKMELVPGQTVETDPLITLQIKHGIHVVIRER
jgi:cytochrome P450